MEKLGRGPDINAEHDAIDGITYDPYWRMQYHPDFHPNHGEPFSLEELIYIAKFYDHDGRRSIAFAIGRTEGTVQTKVDEMKKSEMYEIYKNLSEDLWEKLITPKNRSAQSRKR